MRPKGKYGNYRKTMDTTGKTSAESRPMMTFWSKYKVDDIMQMSQSELDEIIDTFLNEYAADKIKKDKSWWFPSLGNSKQQKYRYEWQQKQKLLTEKKDK